tara:strand:+ start:190 stop:423 length:234 start_codon:yes stop_codon:yes gene_type:complete
MEYHRTSDQTLFDNYSSDSENELEEQDIVRNISELIDLRMQLDDMKIDGANYYRGIPIDEELQNIEDELHYYGWYNN